MNTHVPNSGKSTASRPDEAQTRCQDDRCGHARAHHSAERAQQEAQTHADLTGHTVRVDAEAFSRPLTVVGQLPRCGRCDETVTARTGGGPSITDETNQPCGCTPTAEGQR